MPHVHQRRQSVMYSAPSSSDTRDIWTQIKLAIGDSQNFRDLISTLHWEEGLPIEAVNLIKSRLTTSQGLTMLTPPSPPKVLNSLFPPLSLTLLSSFNPKHT